jgi:ribosome-binding factor A
LARGDIFIPMPSLLRQRRVADRMQQEVSTLLQEMKDPRLELVTVTQVNVDRELEYANIFVSTVGDEARRKEVLAVLEHAKGFVRREIGKRVQLRRAPELVFHWDPSPEKAEHIAQLLDEIKAGAAAPAQPATPPEKTPKPDGDDQPK